MMQSEAFDKMQTALKNATDTIEHDAHRIANYILAIKAKDAYIDDLEVRIVELENELKGSGK